MKRVLIVRTDKVGDVVMITPMIREIRNKYPDAFIATLTTPNTSEILYNNPHLDLLLTDELSKKTFRKVIDKIKTQKFTDALLTMPTERAAYQLFFAGIKNRIGVGRKIYEVITFMKSVSRKNYIPLRHEADYCMDLARAIGINADNITPEIFITQDERNYGIEMFSKNSSYENSFKIIVHTGSGKSSGNWSEKKYLQLINQILAERPGSVIIVTAREMTAPFKNELKNLKDERIIFAVEKIKCLRDLISVIANADLLIASSTGPLHIASALNVSTIGLYCHRKMNCSALWGAVGAKAVNLEISKLYCDSHCGIDKTVCRFEGGISIEEVISKIKKY
ncbi:MAG: glycosyltransferase family 9 protein [Ignavibacteria bacterium]